MVDNYFDGICPQVHPHVSVSMYMCVSLYDPCVHLFFFDPCVHLFFFFFFFFFFFTLLHI